MIYNLGTTVPLTWFNDGVSLGSASLAVTDPNGKTYTQTVSDGGSGTYTANFTPTIYGRFTVLWTASQAGVEGSSQDVFEVRPDAPVALISVADFVDWANLPDAQAKTDANKIQSLIEAASRIAVDITGPQTVQTFTEWFDGGIATISPTYKPVIQVLGAAEYYGISEFILTEQPLGFQTDAFAFTVDYFTGQITRRTYGGAQAQFAIGSKNVRIIYTAGRAYIPENVQIAVKELVRFWYVHTQTPSGRGGRNSLGGEDLSTVSLGYAIPNFVVEMLQPDWRGPGIA